MTPIDQVDSCRNCGKSLEVISNCVVCDQPSQFQCSNCFHCIDDPIHTNCVIIEDNL